MVVMWEPHLSSERGWTVWPYPQRAMKLHRMPEALASGSQGLDPRPMLPWELALYLPANMRPW